MAIQPPKWAKGAVPTNRGWVNPQTNELLKAGKFTQAQIDEFHGHAIAEEIETVVEDQPVFIQEVVELDNLSKRELEEIGRDHGVELDRRKSKATLLEAVKNLIG